MTFTKINAGAATLTRNRTGADISPFSGMCVTCLEGCPGMCEIGKSAVRGAETIYPQPFGTITAASQKNYPVDFSHLNIMGTAVGAKGVDADSDKATFTSVDLEIQLGAKKQLKLRMPFVIPGLGSTEVARRNWEGLAIGAAIAGTVLTIGENVCGMDIECEIKNGKVVSSPELSRRVSLFKEYQEDGYGGIILQSNVEDTRLGVLEYGLEKLGVDGVELKWGQGAKDIGGEVKISDLKKAQLLHERGYIVLPNPTDPNVIKAFNAGAFSEFERHSRIGMVDEKDFIKRVKELRQLGAKTVSLKTGAYRPADLARALKFSSIAKIDYLTVDGAGGGTGMSPWRMMNEWGIPTIELASLTYEYARRLAKAKKYVPDIIIAGGIVLEDQIFKALSLGAPYFKAVGMARGPIAAAMVGKTIGAAIESGKIPQLFEKHGKTKEDLFVGATALKAQFNSQFDKIPTSAIGLYTYYMRLAQGLRQLMCGARKFNLKYMTRDDLVSLTRQAEDITGIPFVMEADKREVNKILGC